jgi:hypothetical protein
MTWVQSLPAVGYAAGQSLANTATHALTGGTTHPEAFPYPNAGDEYRRALETFLPGNAGLGRSAFDDRRDSANEIDERIDRVPWYEKAYDYKPGSAAPTMADQARWDLSNDTVRAGALQDGQEYFSRAGLPDRVATVLGDITDSAWNPLLNVSGIGAAAKAGKLGALTRQLGQEFAPSIVLRGLQQMNKPQR